MPARNQAYLSNKQEERVEKIDTTNGMELNQLNADEISKLKQFL